MRDSREQFIHDLRASYSIYYNIYNNDGDTDLPLMFRADFHNRDESYMLVKSAKVWGNEQNEYVFIFSDACFDEKTVNKCLEFAKETALPLIKPHKEHNYSNIHTLFIADSIDENIRKIITSQDFNKSYNHSLYGFTLLKTVYIDLGNEEFSTNRQGHDMKKVIKKLFPYLNTPKKKWL